MKYHIPQRSDRSLSVYLVIDSYLALEECGLSWKYPYFNNLNSFCGNFFPDIAISGRKIVNVVSVIVGATSWTLNCISVLWNILPSVRWFSLSDLQIKNGVGSWLWYHDMTNGTIKNKIGCIQKRRLRFKSILLISNLSCTLLTWMIWEISNLVSLKKIFF